MHVDEMGECKSNASKNDSLNYNKTQEAHWDLSQRCPVCRKSNSSRVGGKEGSYQAGSQVPKEGT